MDTSFLLAQNIVDTGYDELTAGAIDATKKDMLDIMGTMIAGSGSAGIKELGELTKEWGGKQESTVIAFDCKVPAPSAALINGAMGHALDYDDGHDGAILHAATSVVPAAIAIAERAQGINGKKFITAVALGIDLACRMALACNQALKETGWVYTSIFGYFGAAAAGSKILDLPVEKVVNALGIAFSQSSGSYQSIADAVLTKRLQPGFASRGGVMASILADKGVSGIQNIIDGEWGIYNIYIKGDYDPKVLTSDIGHRFEVENIGFKPYPSCGYTHAPIYGTLKITEQNHIQPEDVQEITISTGQNAAELFSPLQRKRKPESVPDSQFSIPYTVATALVKRRVGMGDFTPEGIKDPEVLRIADKVSPRILPELTRRGVEPAIVEIKTKDGSIYKERVEYRKGSPDNPMTMEELINKFRDCASYGRKNFSKQDIDRVIQLAENLEDIEDVSLIIDLLG